MICENVLFLRILKFFNIAMNVMRFVVPLLLIFKLILDIYHQIIDVNDKNGKEKITKRIVAAIVVFMVPTFVGVLMSFIETVTGMTINYSECVANIKNIDYYVEKEELEQTLAFQQSNGVYQQQYQDDMNSLNNILSSNICAVNNTASNMGYYDNNKENKTSGLALSNNYLANNSLSASFMVNPVSYCSFGSDAIRIGEKYSVTDKQLDDIAKVCQREQGSPKGAAAEAELMINKYILSRYSGTLYDYLFKSSARNWWHPIKTGNYGATKLKPEVKEAVRKVVVEGQRKYPSYINEHDCISCGDVLSIKTDGMSGNKNNRSEYVRDRTYVYTVYKRNSDIKYWIFYDFPDERSDPFGYTYDAKEKLAAISK